MILLRNQFEILFIVKIFSEKRKLKKKRKFSNVRTLPNYTRDLRWIFKLLLGHRLVFRPFNNGKIRQASVYDFSHISKDSSKKAKLIAIKTSLTSDTYAA